MMMRYGVMIGNSVAGHVFRVKGCFVGVPSHYLRWEVWHFVSPIPSSIMSLSDQHPYAKFVAGGLRSPSLAKARVDVGDNTNIYLVSANIVSFRLN